MASTAASSLEIEDIDAAHLARGAMKVSIQRARLGDHGIGYGLLVKTKIMRNVISYKDMLG